MSATTSLPIVVSRFPTAFPVGPAYGAMEPVPWPKLTDEMRARRQGEKDGINLVFARFMLEPDGCVRRLKANALSRTAVALDIEAHKKTGEVPPPIDEAERRVRAQGWSAALYTSHSHVPGSPRYRIVIPLTSEIEPHLPAPEVVAEILGLSGVLDPSKLGAASVFYLPSAAPGKAAQHQTVIVEGAPIAVDWMREKASALLVDREAKQAQQRAEALAAAEARRAARAAAGFKQAENLIEAIRDRLDLEAELLRHGYLKKGDRFLYPDSQTGIPGVHIMRGSDGVERVYSHHGGDPLAAGNLPNWCRVKAIDVVDVTAILDFGGDQTKALHQLATRFGIGKKPMRDEGEPPEHVPFEGELPAGVQMSGQSDNAADIKQQQSVSDERDNSGLVLSPSAPLLIAREFIARRYTRLGRAVLRHQNATFLPWTGTHYIEATHEEIRAQLYHFLSAAKRRTDEGKLVPFNPNKSKVANALEATAAVAQIPSTTRPPVWLDGRTSPAPAEIMACKNGLLHLSSDKMFDHSPDFFSMNALEFDYTPNAPAPTYWLKFLETLWPTDRAARETLQEIFGLLLTGETRHQKAFLLIGPKRSGKGTIARVLTQLLGQANVCGPTLGGLGQNFGLAPLIGKRLAVISDARLGSKVDQHAIVERILAITGEDSLTIDRKFRDAWTGRLETRFLVLSNELPRLSDASGALASRFVTLVLTESFFGKEDHGLTDKLVREMPGILNWAIVGWKRLKHRGYFIPPQSSAEAQRELEDLGSPIGAFLRDRCIVGQGHSARVDDLFEAWRGWCGEQGRDHPGTKASFGKDLRAAVPGLAVIQPRTEDGGRFRYYEGVAVAP